MSKFLPAPALFAMLLLLLVAPMAFAEIFTWVDENGNKHFGDKIPEKYQNKGSQYELSETNTNTAVKVRKKKTTSLMEADLRPLANQNPPESYLPKPKKKTCAQLKEEYSMAESCFMTCRSGNGGNIGGCGHCRDVPKPKC